MLAYIYYVFLARQVSYTVFDIIKFFWGAGKEMIKNTFLFDGCLGMSQQAAIKRG
jgi:hypothetical protein